MTSKPAPFISKLVVYILLYVLAAWIFLPALKALAGYFAGVTLTQLSAALFTNWLALRIFTRCRLPEIGLKWNHASVCNIALGLAGGMGASALALAPPLAARIAWLAPAGPAVTWDIF